MAIHDLLFTDCQVVTPDSIFRGWVAVVDGVVSSMGDSSPPRARRVIDGEGHTLMPGRVEPHCHLRAANFADDVTQVSRQAVAGGVTTLMPYMRSTASYLDLVPEWSRLIETHSFCDVSFHLQIQARQHIAEIRPCRDNFGIQSFKVHLDARHSISDFGLEPVDDGDLYFALLAVREFDGSVAVHCENTEIARYLDAEIRSSGRADLEAWADIRPPIAEAADVNSSVFLASQLGGRLVVVHVSTADSIEAAAAHRYPDVVFETMIHSLAITSDDAQRRIGGGAKSVPPLRSKDELERLWGSLLEGNIHFVGTDHSARSSVIVTDGDAGSRDFWDAREAATGIGVGTPLFLTSALDRGLDLRRASHLMSGGPAAAFRLEGKGALAVGLDADLMLVDLETEHMVTVGTLSSPVRTLADGLSLKGWPQVTCVRGAVVFEGGEIVAEPRVGRAIRQH